MPFKTREKKIKANERKVSISAEGLAQYSSSNQDNFVSEKKVEKKPIFSSPKIGEGYSYVKKDMLNILALSLLIIGLQIILFISNIVS